MGKRPTQTDIAAAVGVSRGLVSLALSGSQGVGPETRAKIIEAADRLGYVRNLNAASLAGQFRSTLGVILPDLRNPFFESVVHELQVYGAGKGLLPMFVSTQNDAKTEADVVRRMLEQQVVGMIFVSPVGGSQNLNKYARQLPVAAIGVDPVGELVDVVHVDEDLAAAMVRDYLSRKGYDRAVFVSSLSEVSDPWVGRRQRALANAFAGSDIDFRSVVEPGSISALLSSVMKPGHSLAVIPHNDLMAIDVVSAARGLGLEPGVDLGVISYDDTHMAERPEFVLTSLRQDARMLASAAIDLVLSRANEPQRMAREELVVPTITVRQSA